MEKNGEKDEDGGNISDCGVERSREIRGVLSDRYLAGSIELSICF